MKNYTCSKQHVRLGTHVKKKKNNNKHSCIVQMLAAEIPWRNSGGTVYKAEAVPWTLEMRVQIRKVKYEVNECCVPDVWSYDPTPSVTMAAEVEETGEEAAFAMAPWLGPAELRKENLDKIVGSCWLPVIRNGEAWLECVLSLALWGEVGVTGLLSCWLCKSLNAVIACKFMLYWDTVSLAVRLDGLLETLSTCCCISWNILKFCRMSLALLKGKTESYWKNSKLIQLIPIYLLWKHSN